MHPSRGEASSAGGFTYLSLPEGQKQQDNKFATDSGAVDSGFHSGQGISSDNLFSSSSEVQEAPVETNFHSGNQKALAQQQQQEEDSGTFDSGFDSSQQSRTAPNDSMRVDDLCKSLLQLQMSRKEQHFMKWEKYFHQNDDGDTWVLFDFVFLFYLFVNASVLVIISFEEKSISKLSSWLTPVCFVWFLQQRQGLGKTHPCFNIITESLIAQKSPSFILGILLQAIDVCCLVSVETGQLLLAFSLEGDLPLKVLRLNQFAGAIHVIVFLSLSIFDLIFGIIVFFCKRYTLSQVLLIW